MRWWLTSSIAVGLLLAFLPILAAGAIPAVPIGSAVEDLRFKDIRFCVHSLGDLGKHKAFALVFVDSSCPLVPRYLPTLSKLEKEYRARGVQFLAVNSSPDDTIREMAQQAVEHNVEFPFVRDIEGRCAAALGVERTPEVVVLDAERVIRYRGRIDDQYRPGGSRPAPTRHDLKEALDAVLAGKAVERPTTPVDGCRIDRAGEPGGRKVTFADDVAPILHKHCAVCHRPDSAAPFPLLTYEDARRKGRAVAEAVADGQMPPWYADPAHDELFTNRRRLTAAERDLVVRWVQGGMARGDADRVPPPPVFTPPNKDGWLIGQPDMVLETEVHELPAEGDIDYRYVALPHIFWDETWLEAVQILPDNPRVVHHANLAFGSISHGIKEANFITGYVPGTRAARLKNGVAFRLPPASALGMQIHFITTGKPETCRIRVGLKFASGTVRKQLRFVLLDTTRMTIPARAPHHAISLTEPLPDDAEAVAIFAHMHKRGKAMVFRAYPPEGGEPQSLLTIPNYSFDWQLSYLYEPGKLRLKKGTKLECVAIFDNSAFNPFNPNPDAVVRYGRQTHEEMINGFFFYVDAHEELNLTVDPKTGRAKRTGPAAK